VSRTIPQLRKALAAAGFDVYMQLSSWYKPTQYFVTDMNQRNWPIVLFGADKETFRAWAVDHLGFED